MKMQRRIRQANRKIKTQMNQYVQSLLLRNAEQMEGGKVGGVTANCQNHLPSVDSPDWGRYHNKTIDLALIKIKPLIPKASDHCRIPMCLIDIEGDNNFIRERSEGSDLGVRNVEIEKIKMTELIPVNEVLELFVTEFSWE